MSMPKGVELAEPNIFVCCFFFENRTLPALFVCYLVPPSPYLNHWLYLCVRCTCRNFPDCPFSVVVRELPGALRPNRKKLSGPFSFFIRFFVCAFACDPRIFYSADATVEKGEERCERKRLCVWQWLTKVVTVEQFNWFIISRADYSPIAFNPTSWIVAIL